MSKTKTAGAQTGAACTSKNNGDTCKLRGEHVVHSTTADVKKVAQHRTWQLAEDGRVHVITFNRGKKMADWFEDAPPTDGRIQDGTAPVMNAEPERCDAKRFGCTRCVLQFGHAGDHFTVGEDSGRASSWAGQSDEMNSWQPCNAVNDGIICRRPEEHDGHHRGVGRASGTLHEWDDDLIIVASFAGGDVVARLLGDDEQRPRELDAGAKADLAKVFGDDGKPAKARSRKKHVEPEVTVEVGHASLTVKVDDGPSIVVWEVGQRVQLAKRRRGPVEIGKVRDLADTSRGRRALVAWPSGGEQFVDLVELEVAPAEQTASQDEAVAAPAPVKFTDLCLKCGLAKHAGKCAKAEQPAATSAYTAPEHRLEKIGSYEVHPAAALFPMIGGADREAFIADLKNGLRRKIVRLNGAILDGRNRLSGCLELGIEPQFREFGSEPGDGDDPITFVISENIARRHLNETQRSFVGAELVPMYEAAAKERQKRKSDPASANVREQNGKATEAAARAVNVSARSIENALKVKRDAAPEVLAAAKDRGELKVSAAADLATLPKSKQTEIIKKVGGGEIRAGKVRSLVRQENKRDVVRKINTGAVLPPPLGPYGVIYADYPWLYENSDQHEGSRGHIDYPPMALDQAQLEVARHKGLQVSDLTIIDHAHMMQSRASEDCILALWTTNWHIVMQMRQVLAAYGATHRTVITWPKPKAGVGTWPRGQTEHLVIASYGEPTHTLNELTTLLESYAQREHSRKPDEVADLLRKHCAGPFLELFGREQREGWTVWGAESKKFDQEAA